MATLTSASNFNTKFSNALDPETSISHLIDASFSSYLDNEEAFASLAKSLSNSNSTNEPQCQLALDRTKNQNGEISIFSAEKYYNEAMDEKKKKKIEMTNNCIRKHQAKEDRKLKIGPGTPSVSSEASWNSQKTLLPKASKERPKNMGKMVNGKRLFAMFSCKCPCSDEKSVEVDKAVRKNRTDYGQFHGKVITEIHSHVPHDQISLVGTKQNPPESQIDEEIPCPKLDNPVLKLQREDCFAFPIVSSGIETLAIEKPLHEEEEGKDRKSLEVFGSPLSDDGDRVFSLERKLALLTWNATHSMKGIEASSVSSEVYNHDDDDDDDDDDVESDSSSDLFEIQNLSTDAYSCFKPQEEDSIFSATDKSTVSDCIEQNSSKKPEELSLTSTSTIAKTAIGKKVQKRHLNTLLSCRSHRAVNVAGEAYMVSEKANSSARKHHKNEH